MRPDDRSGRWQPVDGSPVGDPPADGFVPPESFGPMDADLESLDAELADAGAGARRALRGQTQPTRFFANQLRDRLLATYSDAAAAGGSAFGPATARSSAAGRAAAGSAPGFGSAQARRAGVRPELATPGESWAPVALQPQVTRRTPTILPRARWALLAAATLTGVIAAGALGARFDWLLPDTTAEPSLPVTVVTPTTEPSSDASPAPVITVPTAGPTATAEPTAEATEPASTPKPTQGATPKPAPTAKPTPQPTAKPTEKPEPTKPPVLSMDLMAKACPGGVILDWTKPSVEVEHYHTLRKLDGDVPATYPAAGTTEIETATTFGAGTTDGHDVTPGGGANATYRSFAFDAADGLMASSPSRTVTTVGQLSLGALVVSPAGAGSIDVGWDAPNVNAACFTYGKLVVSEEDPDPSYLKGSTYWAVIDSPSSAGVHLDGLPSGKTVWMRYEVLRVTSTGKFLVARTDVVQVTIP